MHTPSTGDTESTACTEQARRLHVLAAFMTRHQLPTGMLSAHPSGRISLTMDTPLGLARWADAFGKEPARFPVLDIDGPFVAYLVGDNLDGLPIDVAYYDHDEPHLLRTTAVSA